MPREDVPRVSGTTLCPELPLKPDASPEEAQRYYEDFSLRVGLRDWLQPNPRHIQLRLLIQDVVPRNRLRILDVGCGAGVMTAFLRRYGQVTGTDFSSAAIDAARRLVSGVDFRAGTLDELPGGERYDLITLFDVLEHVPAPARPEFLGQLRSRLTEQGLIFISTPFPAFTHQRRERNDPTLQIIDEEVELSDVVDEAADAGLRLSRYVAFDVFAGSPEYQVIVLTPAGAQLPGPPILRDPRLRRPNKVRWRLSNAGRSLAEGRPNVARWFLTGRAPAVDS